MNLERSNKITWNAWLNSKERYCIQKAARAVRNGKKGSREQLP